MEVVKRTFEHCRIKWKVNDFTFLSFKRSEVFCDFEVEGERTTLWRMTLKVFCGDANDRTTSLNIKRGKSAAEPDTVYLDYKICVTDSTGKLQACAAGKALLAKECSHEFNLAQTDTLVDKLKLLEDDSLMLECLLMVIFEGHSASPMPNSRNALFTEVSRDLLQLYEDGKISDVILRIPAAITSVCLPAHKVVLYYRSEALAEKIEKESQNELIAIPQLEFPTMDKVLKYLYSGNVDYVMNEPSIALYECISFLRLHEVRALYIPNEISIDFTAQFQTRRIVWEVKDFPKYKERILKGLTFLSHPIPMPDIGVTWELLLLATKVDGEYKYLGIFAGVVKLTKFYEFYIEFAVLNAREEKVVSKNLLKDGRSMQTPTGFYEFADLDTVNECISEDGSLIIQFTVQIVLDRKSNVRKYMIYKQGAYISLFEEKLLKDISRMHEDKKFADICIVGKEYREKLHKCILCARSFGFETELFGRDKIELTTDCELFSILLCYVYGISREIGSNVYIPELYHLASKYDFPFLAAQYSNFLLSNLSVDNVVDVLRYSHTYYNLKLKHAAIKFIVENFDNYDDHIKRLREENKQLHFEVESFKKERWNEDYIFMLQVSGRPQN